MNIQKIVIGVCMSVLYVASTFALWPIQSQVRDLEQASEIDQSTLYTNITYRPVRQLLESQCSSQSIQKAQAISESANTLVDRRYGSDGAYLLTDTQQVYSLISKLNANLESFSDERYCTVKYVLNAIQLRMREIHLNYMEQTGLINEFGWVNELDPVINWFDAKRGIFDMHIRKYMPSLGRLWAQLQPRILNPEFLNTLTPEQEVLTKRAQQLMEGIIAERMLEFKERWFLSQQEIDDLISKVQFEYASECGIFHGKYELKQVFRWWELVRQEPNSLTLKVNLCPSYFVIRDLPDIFKKIVTHELAHHIYYFSDQRSDLFTTLCWVWDKQRTSACANSDFVTAYAQTNALEDYAEHFMHWFIQLDIEDTPILRQKSLHFEQLQNSL